MEDPTKLDSSGNENKTEIKGNTTGGSPKGDFVAGTVLASRYRIIGLVGKGGMGEVYKAEDIKLSQTVALKFLPESYQNDSDMLERFHAEVRNARQVSHVNVCRVFDIGEIDGRHFLSMEFVDGDDLSELLTRVGRFTSERAVEISRQLCVGMEAIHKAGILHRDFKPANIIIDKKGIARITDFGIAGIESEIAKDGIRAGTPAYMAPEQITGKEVSVRSDIYALGLVIYEIFTGKQAFVADNVVDLIKKHQTETPTNPSEIVKGIDPLVESVIAQCLEKDPKNRPQSALHVAMALPGGNPLQIALDAGQTPSPEMVAASPKKGALRPIVAMSLLGTVLFGLGLSLAISKNRSVNRLVPLDKSPEVLRERSRELLEKYGYLPGDSVSGFSADNGYITHLTENDPSADRWKKLAAGQPAFLSFWYRSSPGLLAPMGDNAGWQDPPSTVPGMARLKLDTKGRLTLFQGVPPRVDEPGSTPAAFDWGAVLKEAGLDLATFEEVEAKWAPPEAFDERHAFSGKYPGDSDVAIRVEAATYRGKLVNFEIVEPWTKPTRAPGGRPSIDFWVPMFLSSIYFVILFGSAWLAVQNVRGGRSDLKGALRIALFLSAARMVIWVFETHHVASFGETNLLIAGLQRALFWGVMAGSIYLALEPYIRKSAPERVISWNRLLAGSWRDPLVGRDLLIGAAVASGFAVMDAALNYFVPVWQGKPPILKLINVRSLAGIEGFPEMFLNSIAYALVVAFMISFLILFTGLLVRRKWLGATIPWVLAMIVSVTGGFETWNETIADMLFWTMPLVVAFRFGVLALLASLLLASIQVAAVSTDLSVWYAGNFLLLYGAILGLTVFGFVTSTAGQKLWHGKLLGDGD